MSSPPVTRQPCCVGLKGRHAVATTPLVRFAYRHGRRRNRFQQRTNRGPSSQSNRTIDVWPPSPAVGGQIEETRDKAIVLGLRGRSSRKIKAEDRWLARRLASTSRASTTPVGWSSWADAAKQFEQVQENSSLLQVFVNTVLGETWTLLGEAPDWKPLYDWREDLKIGTIPRGGLFLMAGADVQRDRIEVEVEVVA